jgi:hypothetical protein
MDTGNKAALGATVVLVLAVGVRVGMIYRERHAPATSVTAPGKEKLPDDAYVFLKKKRPSSLKDVKELVGSTVWVSAGGQMDFYPVAGHKVEYAHRAGTLLGAQPMMVNDAIEQAAPKEATFRIPGGEKQVLLVFTMPTNVSGAMNASTEYAVPVGYREGGQYTFYTDELFFYDDPHTLYKHWGPEVWKAVDEHRAIPGMSEAEVQLALGQVSKSGSETYGNRTVIFSNLGKPIDVTFEKDKATAIRPE